MTPSCVCSHSMFNHFASDGMCFEFDCGCSYYHADDGIEQGGPLGVRMDAYKGIYAGPYSAGESFLHREPHVFACGVCHKTWEGLATCPTCGGAAA